MAEVMVSRAIAQPETSAVPVGATPAVIPAAEPTGARPGPRIGILVVAYNAESHLRSVLMRIPQPIVEKLHADINEALSDPGVRDKLEKLSAEVAPASLQETAAFFKSEIETWRNVIKTADVKLP